MHYWSDRGVRLFVVDGSEVGLTSLHLDSLKDTIHYLHCPNSLFTERLEKVINLISTKYVAMISDDEFFIPSALISCIKELEVNKDLVSCGGLCIQFNYKKNKVNGRRFYQSMKNYTLLHDNPFERMLAHMNPYTPSSIYSVVRSEVWKRSYLTTFKNQFKANCLLELQFELAVCYHGKSKVISEVMWLRSNELLPIKNSNESSLHSEISFESWWNNPCKINERNELLSNMANTLMNNKNDFERIKLGITQALDLYAMQNKKNLQSAAEIFRDYIMISLWSSLPSTVKNILRYILNPFKKFNTTESLLLVARRWHLEGIKVDFKALLEIENVLHKFYKTK